MSHGISYPSKTFELHNKIPKTPKINPTEGRKPEKLTFISNPVKTTPSHTLNTPYTPPAI
jgi:hypothetical protein